MTEQLYRWVSVTKDTFPEENGEYHWRNKETKLPISPALAYTTARIGERYHAVEMLEPYTSSLNAGSLEEAAKKWVNDNGFPNFSTGGFDWELQDTQALKVYNSFLAGAAYVKGGEEKGLSKEEIAQICEMADNDYAAQEAILFAEFLRKNNMGPNGFGGWGGGDINTNYYGSTEVKLYELFKKRPLASRPSLDIDKVVDEDCAKTCYHILKEHYENMDGKFMDWDKLKELLNQQPSSQSPEHKSDREPGGGGGEEQNDLWNNVYTLIDGWGSKSGEALKRKLLDQYHITRK